MKRICACIALLGLSIGSALAASGSVRPAALDHAISRLSTVEMRTMPAVDVPRLQAEDRERDRLDLPTRFAQPLAVDLTPLNSGTWEDLDAANVVWRLRVESRGALSLNFGFSEVAMPVCSFQRGRSPTSVQVEETLAAQV